MPDSFDPLALQVHHGGRAAHTVSLHLRANIDFLLAVGLIVPFDGAADSLLKRDSGLVAKELVSFADVGTSVCCNKKLWKHGELVPVQKLGRGFSLSKVATYEHLQADQASP